MNKIKAIITAMIVVFCITFPIFSIVAVIAYFIYEEEK